MLRRTIAITVVIYTVLHGAVYALDVLVRTSAFSAFFHFDNRPFGNFGKIRDIFGSIALP